MLLGRGSGLRSKALPDVISVDDLVDLDDLMLTARLIQTPSSAG